MSKKIEDRLQKNKELALLISNLKGIGGDKPTDVKPPSTRKKAKKESASSVIKKIGDLAKKNKSSDPYSDYEPGDWGSDTDLGDFESASWFGETDDFGGGGGYIPVDDYSTFMSFKKGGRLKKAKKKAPRKRAALRGQRSELRGS